MTTVAMVPEELVLDMVHDRSEQPGLPIEFGGTIGRPGWGRPFVVVLV